MDNPKSSESSRLSMATKNNTWVFGATALLIGITDRSIASFGDGYLSAIDLLQLSIATFFFIAWLYLKPAQNLATHEESHDEFC